MRAAGALAASLLAAAGCTQQFDPCFAPVQHVKDLRILGVRADPPEIVYDPADASPSAVSVRVLVGDPDPADPVTVMGRACVPTADGRCPDGSVELTGTTGVPGDLALSASIPRALVDAARDADPLKGTGGVRVQLDLRVTASFNREALAHKLLIFNPAAPGYVPNHGIEILALEITRGGVPAGLAAPGDEQSFVVGEFVGVRPLLAPGPGGIQAEEDFDVIDLQGRPAHLKETVTYSFYTTLHARFLSDTAQEPPDGSGRELVKFEPTFEAFGQLYVVARDGRGGEAWFIARWDAIDLRQDDKKRSLEVDCAE